MKIRTPVTFVTRVAPEVRAGDDLPPGVCGRIRAAILTYGVVDKHGTVFRAGALDRTRAKVAAGKVEFFEAADGARHQYGTRTHLGIVRTLERVGNQEVATVDLYDTAPARAYKEYVEAVTTAGGNTGFSVGGFDRSPTATFTDVDGGRAYTFTEFELEELTGTARASVPGTGALHVRTEAAASGPESDALFAVALRGIARAVGADRFAELVRQAGEPAGDTPPADGPASRTDAEDTAHVAPSDPAHARAEDTPGEMASMEDRLAALRNSYRSN